MTNQESFDETDIKILKLLQQNSHMTVKELAARVHLSTSPTFERQKRLEREGYIKRYTAVVDHHKMGHNVIVLCNIRLKQHTRLDSTIHGHGSIDRPNNGVLQHHRRLRLPNQGVCARHERLPRLHAQHPGKHRLYRKPAQHYRYRRDQRLTLHSRKQKEISAKRHQYSKRRFTPKGGASHT